MKHMWLAALPMVAIATGGVAAGAAPISGSDGLWTLAATGNNNGNGNVGNNNGNGNGGNNNGNGNVGNNNGNGNTGSNQGNGNVGNGQGNATGGGRSYYGLDPNSLVPGGVPGRYHGQHLWGRGFYGPHTASPLGD